MVRLLGAAVLATDEAERSGNPLGRAGAAAGAVTAAWLARTVAERAAGGRTRAHVIIGADLSVREAAVAAGVPPGDPVTVLRSLAGILGDTPPIDGRWLHRVLGDVIAGRPGDGPVARAAARYLTRLSGDTAIRVADTLREVSTVHRDEILVDIAGWVDRALTTRVLVLPVRVVIESVDGDGNPYRWLAGVADTRDSLITGLRAALDEPVEPVILEDGYAEVTIR